MKTHNKNIFGFTIIEMVITVAIFALISALVIGKFGTLNQDTAVTNLAYDVALSLKTAQAYGISAKSPNTVTGPFDASAPENYNTSYGVHFLEQSDHYETFVDANDNGLFDPTDPIVNVYQMKNGSKITDVYAASDHTSCHNGGQSTEVTVTYKRPNPNAIIMTPSCTHCPYSEITVAAPDGESRTVVIRSTGAVEIQTF